MQSLQYILLQVFENAVRAAITVPALKHQGLGYL